MRPLMRWLPLGVALGIVLLLWQALTPAGDDHDKVGIGRTLPSLTLTTPEGKSLDTRILRGRPFLLNVWASWCANCRSEHPLLTTLAGKLPIVGLNYRDKPAAAQAWLEQAGNPYELVLDDGHGAFSLALGVIGTPETWLVGADGTLLARHSGVLTETIWQSRFAPLLKETTP